MKRKVIIDCDPGIDDALALMLALNHEDIEVLGITIVCGNAPAEMGFANAHKVLAHLGRQDVKVYLGAKQPLALPFCDALDTHGSDGLGESFLPQTDAAILDLDAVTFLSQTLHETNCSIIALGPLTNLAHLIERDAQAFARIDRLVSMGGAFRTHGNCSPVAEYNYWEDPQAAQCVYAQMEQLGKQVEMVGLDVTRRIVLTMDLLAYIERLDPKEGAFIRAITKFYFDFHWRQEHLIGCVINDPLAVAYFIDPSLCEGFSSYVASAGDGLARGQSIVDAASFYQRPHNAQVLTKVDVLAFFRMFFAALLHQEASAFDLLPVLIASSAKKEGCA